MDFTPYSDYFEALATKLNVIGHTPEEPRFCHFNIEEVLAQAAHRLGLDHYSLLLESFEGRLQDNGSDQIFDNQDGAFLIVRRVEAEDFPGEKQVIDETKRIGLKVIARIQHDIRAGNNPVMSDFDLSQVEYHKVGPIFDNVFGHRFTFSNSDGISVVVDESDWSDL